MTCPKCASRGIEDCGGVGHKAPKPCPTCAMPGVPHNPECPCVTRIACPGRVCLSKEAYDSLKTNGDAAMLRLNTLLNDERLYLRQRRDDGRWVAEDLGAKKTFGPFESPVEAIDAYLAAKSQQEGV